ETTTIGDLIEHLETELGNGGSAADAGVSAAPAAAHAAEARQIALYAPAAVVRHRSRLPGRRFAPTSLLITRDDRGIADLMADRFAARGVAVTLAGPQVATAAVSDAVRRTAWSGRAEDVPALFER